MVLLLPYLPEQSKVFQEGWFSFAQMKSSVDLCVDKLTDPAVKSEPLDTHSPYSLLYNVSL